MNEGAVLTQYLAPRQTRPVVGVVDHSSYAYS
jgi:hypothetical protein